MALTMMEDGTYLIVDTVEDLEGEDLEGENMTMDEMYGDGSDCTVCEECGFCSCCGDCEEFGCGATEE